MYRNFLSCFSQAFSERSIAEHTQVFRQHLECFLMYPSLTHSGNYLSCQMSKSGAYVNQMGLLESSHRNNSVYKLASRLVPSLSWVCVSMSRCDNSRRCNGYTMKWSICDNRCLFVICCNFSFYVICIPNYCGESAYISSTFHSLGAVWLPVFSCGGCSGHAEPRTHFCKVRNCSWVVYGLVLFSTLNNSGSTSPSLHNQDDWSSSVSEWSIILFLLLVTRCPERFRIDIKI